MGETGTVPDIDISKLELNWTRIPSLPMPSWSHCSYLLNTLMNIYLLLILFPVVWGIVGLKRGRMAVSNRKELKPQDVKRFAWAFIVIPIALATICATGFTLLTVFEFEKDQIFYSTMLPFMVILPLALAFVLDRARRVAKPIKIPPSDSPDFSSVSARDKSPDFSHLIDDD